jgi:imidazole glycerol phosphate synthase subunit HisF
VGDGRVFKGVRFLELRDVGDPVDLATRYSDLGADELVFLDIAATSRAADRMEHLAEAFAAGAEAALVASIVHETPSGCPNCSAS